jgi:hypothetical protein
MLSRSMNDDAGASSFRSNARVPHHEIVIVATSTLRKMGYAFAAFASIPMAVMLLFFSERHVELTCSRNAMGAGQCVRAVTHVFSTSRETFDVQNLRGAHAETYQTKSGPTYRIFLDLADSSMPLAEADRDSSRVDGARRIDQFAHDPLMATLDENVENTFAQKTGLPCMFIFGGFVIAWCTHRYWAPRRVVVSEREGFVRLEQRRWPLPWRTLWAIELRDFREARVVSEGKNSRLVVSTRDDRSLVVSEYFDDGTREANEINRCAAESGAPSPT